MAELNKESESTQTKAKGVLRRIARHENAVLGFIFVVIVVVLAIVTKGLSVSAGNIKNVLLQSSTRGIAAIGQTFVILTGGIDLAVGGLALFASVLGASLNTTVPESMLFGYTIPIGVAVFTMFAIGIGWGAIDGLSVSRLRMPSLIVTLAMWQVLTGAAYQITRGTSIHKLDRSFSFVGQGEVAGIPMPTIIFILVSVVAYLVLYHTTFGRSVYAAGGNPISSWLSGLNVPKILIAVYTISGFTAALSGVILTSRIMSASMMSANGLEIDSIAAVAIGGISLAGGRGSLIGVIIGVMIIGVVNNGMNIAGLDPSFQQLVRGFIIFAAVAVDVVRRR